MRFALALAAVAVLAPARALADCTCDHDSMHDTSSTSTTTGVDTTSASVSNDSVYWYGDYERLDDRSQVPKSVAPDTTDEALRRMYDTNLKELRELSFALAHAEDDDTRDYIEELIVDHTMNNEDVIAMARDRGIQLGDGPAEREVRVAISPLRGLEGESFDTAFTDAVVRGHEQVHQELLDMSARVADDDLDAFAEDTADVVEDHFDEGVDLADDLGLDADVYPDELPG